MRGFISALSLLVVLALGACSPATESGAPLAPAGSPAAGAAVPATAAPAPTPEIRLVYPVAAAPHGGYAPAGDGTPAPGVDGSGDTRCPHSGPCP